ncbi:SpoIIE family protein phosphatase [Streptomyces sp. 5-8]|uniref:SpoIIE family protein phosphatase n=1 Tax=Streptomyces musisoli TaxID=2802280 RepID=A0ABS1NVQ2_9ACTN|nr:MULTISPECIES: ATP-binding SpoIIE family protein phosphatase [Streptomyces]MBL1104181.1 SpoIIE family protein phosphatase [Streptomyces musisoli]MBY8840254.1 SpoIIE family protein phosphatase [Streptomyces sp. SP2-10]
MSRVWEIPVHDSTRVRDARIAAREACGEAGLAAPRTAIAELVATELATNLLKHAGGGRMVTNLVERPDGGAGPSVQLFSLDHGPGIADVDAALRDGYSTAPGSLGAGLGSCRRSASAFHLYSLPGRGTVATARIDPEPGVRGARPAQVPAGGIAVALGLAEQCGDAWAWVRSGTLRTLLLADGLGHGPKAAHASTAAVTEFRHTAHLPPADILRRLHTALRPTRGAAVAVAQVDTERAELTFAGVGNVGARMRTGDSWTSLVSHPGIVGAYFPAQIPVRRMPWDRDSLLVLHSDGLPSRWAPPEDPRLLAHDPSVVAAAILRDAGSPARPVRDDTSVAVLAPDRRTSAHDSRL